MSIRLAIRSSPIQAYAALPLRDKFNTAWSSF
jgi:hypothetical protein